MFIVGIRKLTGKNEIAWWKKRDERIIEEIKMEQEKKKGRRKERKNMKK